MGAPAKDHFNPQFLLRHFADAEGRLYFFDKRIAERRVRRGSPASLFFHKHLYSTIEADGTKDRTLDVFYRGIENESAPIIARIIEAARRRCTPALSLAEKEAWDLFLYNQWRRVPDCYSRFIPTRDEVLALIAKFERDVRPLTEAERAYWNQPEEIDRLRNNAAIDGLRLQGEMPLAYLAAKGLGIAVISRPNKAFVTGSFPVVKLTNPRTPALSHPSTELWLALSSEVAVTPWGNPGTETIVEIPSDRHIRAINEAVLRQSVTIAARSPELVASLANLPLSRADC